MAQVPPVKVTIYEASKADRLRSIADELDDAHNLLDELGAPDQGEDRPLTLAQRIKALPGDTSAQSR